MVALYWLENFRFTYWFINEVLPTPESPRMMTFKRIFRREAIFNEKEYEMKKGSSMMLKSLD